ncbi:threonine--tRNA ligase [Buchnera aphidicola]|uniref:threonine--tRNA ligase n=1 Tax=Buchnera aphidicola TaxID=9 RepID=UPI00346459DA
MPVITLLNGKKRVYQNTISLVKVAEDISIGLSKNSIGAIVNGQLVDLRSMILYDSQIHILTYKDKKAINFIKYSYIQLLSYACKKIWKHSKIGIGGITKNGFYCDIDINSVINYEKLSELECIMKDLINIQYNIILQYILKSEVKKIFYINNECYKLYYIEKIFCNKKIIPIYFHEEYLDIYLGPQVPNIKFCSSFKLQNISGAYWESNKNNNMLHRIYGLCWLNDNQSLKYLQNVEKIKNKDHRILNKKMDLYHSSDVAPGMIFWHGNGLIIFQELKNFIRIQLKKWEYEEVQTPIVMNESVWKTSGHIENFSELMFYVDTDNKRSCIKPMNCPGHIYIYNNVLRSYRDLPVRLAEFGVCHRNETSGSLNGLLRLKSFTQDDAHIFCTLQQVQSEIINCINITNEIYRIFGFQKIHVKFSTRPEKRIGSDTIWDYAEENLKNALLKHNIDFTYQIGEGAFYGPKIEFVLEDRLNRLWQCGTIQLDFYLPNRFSASYIDENNKKKIPIIIHRAILGSIERFIGILLEEYVGFLPTWLSPLQVIVVNINNNNNNYALKVFKKLVQYNIRVKYDIGNEKINFKIRKYTMQRVSYILICGDKESSTNTVSVRYGNNNMINLMNIDLFIKKITYEIKNYLFNSLEE